ncbi:MAG: BlaI family penicillinase repressor [Candidatus Paceibacteria bacterium]|jgi:BlaI family penicillinase repressor
MNKAENPDRLTDLELEIMQVIWAMPQESPTVREVADALNRRDSKALAYTTVQTMLGILCRKGALESKPGPGRAHLFRPLVSRTQARSSMTKDLVERLFGGESKPLFAALLSDESIGRAELESLRDLIDEQLDDEQPGGGGL